MFRRKINLLVSRRVLQSLSDLFKSKQKNSLEGNIAPLLMFRVFRGIAETIADSHSEGSR